MAKNEAAPDKATASKRAKVSQTDIPRFSLEKALAIAQAIYNGPRILDSMLSYTRV